MTRLMLLLAAMTAGVSNAAEPIGFADRHIEAQASGCKSENCARAAFNFIDAISGPTIVRNRINSAIRDFLIAGADDVTLTPQEYAAKFVADYETVREAEEIGGRVWSLFKTVKVLRTAAPIVSLECFEGSYTGGVHPQQSTLYLNFDARTGEKIELASILNQRSAENSRFEPRLNAIAEAHFRKHWDLGPDADVESPFHVNDNFGVTNDTLIFTFNVNEIGPRALGVTTIKIPFSEIRDMLRPDLLR